VFLDDIYSEAQDGLSNLDSLLEPIGDSTSANSQFYRPRVSTLGFTIKRYFKSSFCNPSIVGLFFSVSPLAVFFAIRSVIVNSFNCVVLRWPRTHVGIKIFKGMPPAIADRYTTPSPVCIPRISFTIASTVNSHPNVMFRRIRHAVSPLSFGLTFFSVTSTTGGMSASYISTVSYNFGTAITCAYPHCSSVLDMRKSYDREPTEALPRNFLESRSPFYINRISHKLNSYLVLVRAHFRLKIGDELDLNLVAS